MIEVVSATRLSERDFWRGAPLGLSMRRLTHDDRLVTRVAFSNRLGLTEIYNARILAADVADTMVFIHDDVWIDEDDFGDRVEEGLKSYDVIGVAGNRRRVASQPAWAFVDTSLTWDDRAHLSGAIAHGAFPPGRVSFFGAAPAACELLDGVMLAVKPATLRNHEVWFDPRFQFHFYDLDFCRSARQSGLRLGTWPIRLTHQSSGAFRTREWKAACQIYMDKWRGQVECPNGAS